MKNFELFEVLKENFVEYNKVDDFMMTKFATLYADSEHLDEVLDLLENGIVEDSDDNMMSQTCIDVDNDGDLAVLSRHCGTGRGCFWTEWQ